MGHSERIRPCDTASLMAKINDVAVSVPFDNSTDGWVANNVQAAIEEAPIHLRALNVSGTSTLTVATSTDTLLPGMTLSPPAGLYQILFSTDVNSAVGGAAISVSIYIGGAQVVSTLRKVVPCPTGLLGGAGRDCVAINDHLTVTTGQAVEVRASTSNTGPTVASRALSLLRLT